MAGMLMQAMERKFRKACEQGLALLDHILAWFRVPHELERFLKSEERQTHVWMAYARFALVGIFLFFALMQWNNYDSWDHAIYRIGMPLIFLPAAMVQLLASRFDRPNGWLKYVIISIDVLMLGYLTATPLPYMVEAGSPEAIEEMIRIYRGQEMQSLYILYSWVLISQSARFVAYFGVLLWVAWITHLYGILQLPDVFTMNEVPEFLQGATQSVIERHPRFVDSDIAGQNMSIVFILTVGFIVVIRRTRSLTARLFRSEQSRTALSRYFSPDIVDRVLGSKHSGLQSDRRDTVILFADLIDFTHVAEDLPPDEVFELLREFHGVIESDVFSHNGTMEKYIGDAVLATFGGLDGSADDAGRALSCALSLQTAMGKLNKARQKRGARPLDLAIGLHYGPTVSGVIGEGRNMAFVVTGASVAIANRVQAEARKLKADIVLSDAFFDRCQSERGGKARLKKFKSAPARKLKGLSQPVSLWSRPR